jgi:hypothetical protein
VEAAESAKLGAAEDVHARPPVLQTADMEEPLAEVALIPAGPDQLAGAELVPVGKKDHGRVAVAVPGAS